MLRTILRPNQLGYKKSTINDRQRAGLYPCFFNPSPNTAAVFQDEHERVMALVAAGATDDEIRT